MKGCKVLYKSKWYFGIIEFDCKTIGLYTTDPDNQPAGTFYTSIPISVNGRGRVVVTDNAVFTTFAICDDWGRIHSISIRGTETDAIADALSGAHSLGVEVEDNRIFN